MQVGFLFVGSLIGWVFLAPTLYGRHPALGALRPVAGAFAIGLGLLLSMRWVLTLRISDPDLERGVLIRMEEGFRTVYQSTDVLPIPPCLLLILICLIYFLALRHYPKALNRVPAMHQALAALSKYGTLVSFVQVALFVAVHVTFLGSLSGTLAGATQARLVALDRDIQAFRLEAETAAIHAALQQLDGVDGPLEDISHSLTRLNDIDRSLSFRRPNRGQIQNQLERVEDRRRKAQQARNKVQLREAVPPRWNVVSEQQLIRAREAHPRSVYEPAMSDRFANADERLGAMKTRVLQIATETVMAPQRAELVRVLSAEAPLLAPFIDAIAVAVGDITTDKMTTRQPLTAEAVEGGVRGVSEWIARSSDERSGRSVALKYQANLIVVEVMGAWEDKLNAAQEKEKTRARVVKKRNPLRSYPAWKRAIVDEYGRRWNDRSSFVFRPGVRNPDAANHITETQFREWYTGEFTIRHHGWVSNVEVASYGQILVVLRRALDAMPSDEHRMEFLREANRTPRGSPMFRPPGPREISKRLAETTADHKWKRWAGHFGVAKYRWYSPAATRQRSLKAGSSRPKR